jgi:hypothetical protein
MSQTVSSSKQLKSNAGVAKVDMKFEVAIVPISDLTAQKRFTRSLDGGSMTISSMAMIFVSFS